MKRSSWPWLLAGGVALAALVYFLADRFPGALSSEGSGFRVIYLVALLALVGSGLLHRRLGLTPRLSSTPAATPSPSRMRPISRCSVPI